MIQQAGNHALMRILKRFGPALTLAVFWAAFAIPVLASGERLGIWDWDHHFAFYEFERAALLAGVLPVWNPHVAGGMVALQHPLSSFLWPDFLWLLAFGVPVGVKLQLLFRLAVGLAGGYALGRDLRLGRAAAVLASLLMNGSGAWAAHVAFGHYEWTLFGYVPWALVGCLRAVRDRSPAWFVVAVACMAGVYLGGSIYVLVGFAFLLACLCVLAAAVTRDLRALVLPLLALVLSAPLSAAKLLPTADYFGERPRTTRQSLLLLQADPVRGWRIVPRTLQFVLLEDGFDYPLEFTNPPSHVHRAFTRGEGARRFALFQDINYNGYVGVVPLLLVLTALVLPGRRRIVLGGAVLAFLCLVLSDALQRAFGVHPWCVVKKLPALGSLGVAGRFLILALVPLGLLAGIGLDALCARLARWRGSLVPVFAGLVVAVVGADLVRHGAPLLARSFPHAPVDVDPVPFTTYLDPLRGSDLVTVRAGVGALRAHNNLVSQHDRRAGAIDQRGYRGEAFTLGRGRATLQELDATGARVRVEVSEGEILVLNQSWFEGWQRLDRDARVFERQGLVATRVTPADRDVRLAYRPAWLRAGLGISAATLLAGLAVLGVSLRHRLNA